MNLIDELQQSAEQEGVLTVLRKARRLAAKLGRDDVDRWLAFEQEGYEDTSEVPDYRAVPVAYYLYAGVSMPRGFAVLQQGTGRLPVPHDEPYEIREPISAVLSWLSIRDELCKGIPANSDLFERLCRSARISEDCSPQFHFVMALSGSQLSSIPERIKDRVLSWACALEAAGIPGANGSFSPEDLDRARNVVFNFNGCQIAQWSVSGQNRTEQS